MAVRSAVHIAGKVGPILLALALGLVLLQSGAAAKHTPDHQPANKFAVAGSGLLVEFTEETQGEIEDVTLLSTTMKNPGSKALVLSVTLECAILTDLFTSGLNDLANSQAKAEVWVEVNGKEVKYEDAVTNDDDEPGGKVVFCEREYERRTRNWPGDCSEDNQGEEQCVIDDFIRTRAAHGFDWVALDDGSGVKTVEVKATLTRETEGRATATLAIGARTLTVEPVDVAKDETLSN